MTARLRKKVERALIDAAGEGCHIELYDLEGERLTGIVVSSCFTPMSLAERHDFVCDCLDGRLSAAHRRRVVFIAAVTPEVYEEVYGRPVPKVGVTPPA